MVDVLLLGCWGLLGPRKIVHRKKSQPLCGHHHHLLVVIVKPYATRLVVSRSILLLSSLWVLLRTAIRRRTSVLLFQSNFSRAVQLEVARRTNMMVQLGLATAAAVNEVGTILQALVRCAHRFS